MVDERFEAGKKNMREQVGRYLSERYADARVNPDATTHFISKGKQWAFELHFEVWADPLGHVFVTDTACVVTHGWANIADVLEQIGAWNALDVPPNAIGIFADRSDRGVRWEPVDL